MKLITAHFDHPGKTDYARLLKVWKYSAQKHMPESQIEICHIDPPTYSFGNQKSWINNHIKLSAYSRIKIEEPTILIDCDTLIQGDLSIIFKRLPEFDVCLTKRTSCKWPINGGVVFLRPGERTQKLMDLWGKIDERMYVDKELHAAYRHIYGGMNQASLGYIISRHKIAGLVVELLPCSIWNACDEDWPLIGDYTMVLHVKGDLRKVCLSDAPIAEISESLRSAASLWRRYEDEANART